MNYILKIQKKAFKEIRQIETAKNFLEVESAINTAILRAFGLYNIGLMKIAMKEGYTELQKNYGCSSYKGDFDKMKIVRTSNMEAYGNYAKLYLLEQTNQRVKKCQMFVSAYKTALSKI